MVEPLLGSHTRTHLSIITIRFNLYWESWQDVIKCLLIQLISRVYLTKNFQPLLFERRGKKKQQKAINVPYKQGENVSTSTFSHWTLDRGRNTPFEGRVICRSSYIYIFLKILDIFPPLRTQLILEIMVACYQVFACTTRIQSYLGKNFQPLLFERREKLGEGNQFSL